jgi:hypothetical protein
MSDTGSAMIRLLLTGAVLAAGCVPLAAAPVPKALKTPRAKVTVSRNSPATGWLTVGVTNQWAEDLTWEYSTSPLAVVGIEVTDAKGERLEVVHPDTIRSPFHPPLTCTVKAGGERNMSLDLDALFRHGRPSGPLTVKVTFTAGGQVFESKPLEVKGAGRSVRIRAPGQVSVTPAGGRG